MLLVIYKIKLAERKSDRPVVFGCGGRIRTYDLRVMSPTSCQTAPSRVRFDIGAVER